MMMMMMMMMMFIDGDDYGSCYACPVGSYD